VLKIGEIILTESTAIMTYLALTYPRYEFVDNSPIGLARTLEWMNWLSSIHASIIAQNWRTERFSDNTLAHKEIQAKGMKNLFEISTQIDTKLEGTNWAIGDHYSIVDPYLLAWIQLVSATH
jgi:glutathione S-transferase